MCGVIQCVSAWSQQEGKKHRKHECIAKMRSLHFGEYVRSFTGQMKEKKSVRKNLRMLPRVDAAAAAVVYLGLLLLLRQGYEIG